MEKLNPFFEVNGKTYEIKKTRALLVEVERLGKEDKYSKADQIDVLKFQQILEDVNKLRIKLDDAEKEYFETFSDMAERKYLKLQELYNNKYDEFAEYSVEHESASKLGDMLVSRLEKIAIYAIEEQHALTHAEAVKLWESYVDEVGKNTASEWLVAMNDVLFNEDEEEETTKNDFLSRFKAMKSQKNTKKKG